MEQLVADIVEKIYGSQNKFLTEYTRSPKIVLRRVAGRMKVVPINLRTILREFFEGLADGHPDLKA